MSVSCRALVATHNTTWAAASAAPIQTTHASPVDKGTSPATLPIDACSRKNAAMQAETTPFTSRVFDFLAMTPPLIQRELLYSSGRKMRLRVSGRAAFPLKRVGQNGSPPYTMRLLTRGPSRSITVENPTRNTTRGRRP